MNRNELIKEMSLDKNIKAFLNVNSLDSNELDDHYNVFKDFYLSNKKCEKCLGLHCCKQLKTGQHFSLAYDGGVFNEITYCPYKLDKLKKDKHIGSFVRNDIPEEYAHVTLENVDILDDYGENLCALMFDILDGKRNKGLFIYGNLGVGKTYMCIALANSLVKKGCSTAFIKANYFVNEMRKLVATNNNEYEQTINKLKKVDYLIVDDIGSESVSTYSRDDLIFNILDYRMENHKVTLFTSNLSKEALLKHYTFDKNDNSSIIRAKRLMERIDILSDNFVLEGKNKRRS